MLDTLRRYVAMTKDSTQDSLSDVSVVVIASVTLLLFCYASHCTYVRNCKEGIEESIISLIPIRSHPKPTRLPALCYKRVDRAIRVSFSTTSVRRIVGSAKILAIMKS